MWEPFNEDARRAIVLAQEAAVQLGNNYIGSEHLLAGIVSVPGSMGAKVLTSLRIDLDDLRKAIDASARPATNVTQEMVFTPGATRAIESAFEEARVSQLSYLGTEHLLLGILHEPAESGASILREAGIDLAAARAGTARLQRAGVPFSSFDHVQLAMPPGREDEARGFYATLLGMTEIPKPVHLAKRGGAWFASGDLQLHLGVDEDFHAARKAHPALRCTDYDGLVARLAAAGVEVQAEQGRTLARAYISDPFGNRIELIGY